MSKSEKKKAFKVRLGYKKQWEVGSKIPKPLGVLYRCNTKYVL